MYARLVVKTQRVCRLVFPRTFAEFSEMRFLALALIALARSATRADLLLGVFAVGTYAIGLERRALTGCSRKFRLAVTSTAITIQRLTTAFLAVELRAVASCA